MDLNALRDKYKAILSREEKTMDRNEKRKMENFENYALPSLSGCYSFPITNVNKKYFCLFAKCFKKNSEIARSSKLLVKATRSDQQQQQPENSSDSDPRQYSVSFTTKQTLVRHLLSLHGDELPDRGAFLLPNTLSSTLSSSSSSGKQQQQQLISFECEACKTQFKRKDHLEQHLKAEKNAKCHLFYKSRVVGDLLVKSDTSSVSRSSHTTSSSPLAASGRKKSANKMLCEQKKQQQQQEVQGAAAKITTTRENPNLYKLNQIDELFHKQVVQNGPRAARDTKVEVLAIVLDEGQLRFFSKHDPISKQTIQCAMREVKVVEQRRKKGVRKGVS